MKLTKAQILLVHPDAVISETGKIHGRGRQRYRWVSGLTDDERSLVRDGETVLIEDLDAHHYTQCGWKMVTYCAGKYGHREARV